MAVTFNLTCSCALGTFGSPSTSTSVGVEGGTKPSYTRESVARLNNHSHRPVHSYIHVMKVAAQYTNGINSRLSSAQTY